MEPNVFRARWSSRQFLQFIQLWNIISSPQTGTHPASGQFLPIEILPCLWLLVGVWDDLDDIVWYVFWWEIMTRERHETSETSEHDCTLAVIIRVESVNCYTSSRYQQQTTHKIWSYDERWQRNSDNLRSDLNSKSQDEAVSFNFIESMHSYQIRGFQFCGRHEICV